MKPPICAQKATFDSFNPRVAVSIKTGGSGILYANAAKGFRSGGFNLLGQPAYGPETLWTYEAGLKQSFANGRVYLELAGYYNKYDNVQTVSPLTGSTITVDGVAYGEALERDRMGRPLPVWRGCRRIAHGELFLMNFDVPDSLDGRYFGPLPASTVIGRAVPLYTDEAGDGHFVWRTPTR